jgi:hypothetical protein
MARRIRTMADNRNDAESAAWREYGKRNFAWIVGWAIARKLIGPALIVAVPVALVVWIARTIDGISAPGLPDSSPISAGPWPLVLLALSAGGALFLFAYRWANPYRGGKILLTAAFACLLISVLAILWANAAY